MSFKKYNDSTWQPITPKKLKGIPYTGTLPTTLTGTKAGYLHRYKIYGNTEQNGTPTPENPIVPSGCGVRTENLFDVQDFTHTGEQAQMRIVLWEGTLPEGTYTVSVMQESELTSSVRNTLLVTVNDVIRYESTLNNYHNNVGLHTMTFDANDGDAVSISYWIHTLSNPCTYGNAMFNLGSTALPYEPYGYKLPLTSAGQDVDIYLGEVQTTRRIKKLTLTGAERMEVYMYASQRGVRIINVLEDIYRRAQGLCNIYPVKTQAGTERCVWVGSGGGDNALYFISILDTMGLETINDFKSYLAAQYAAGTPVTVWYVLAEPETGIVNEPLMKIGNYADTIDSTQNTVQIPTAAGETTISWAGEGLAPSQFDSIQEWVDIPTYTYTSGAWVVDN